MTLSDMKGIGPANLLKLHEAGIYTVLDLLNTFPKRVLFHQISPFEAIRLQEPCCLKAEVLEIPKVAFLRKNFTKLTVKVQNEQHIFLVSIFNREFLRTVLQTGTSIVIEGRFDKNFDFFTATSLLLETSFEEGFVPEYQLSSISDKQIRKFIQNALLLVEPIETLDPEIIGKYSFPTGKDFYRFIHQPNTRGEFELAQNRLKYEELFRFALQLKVRQEEAKSYYVSKRAVDIQIVKKLTNLLPFECTVDQKQVINEIFKDFQKTHPMQRIVQGDVGSGKTIVALFATLGMISAGKQVAIMAPTEILAKQHWYFFEHYLNQFQITGAFLSGSVRKNQRERIIQGLKLHHLQFVVGTHALFQDAIEFADLGLVIVDEQHRFGVMQRLRLLEKGKHPDYLMMTATPIPRTLAFTIFAQMDISIIKSLPFGEKKITSKVVSYEDFEEVFAVIKDTIARHEQVYVVAPFIFERQQDKSSVEQAMSFLKQQFPNQLRIGGLHGSLNYEEKDALIHSFKNQLLDVLVSTTVVEVGIDNPNATLMIVLDAERFGLSQLHQLRGRIGRGEKPSTCYFVSDQVLLPDSRLNILENTLDGFEISEADLASRGPGELLGRQQTGIPVLQYAHFFRDIELLKKAIDDVNQYWTSSNPWFQKMKKLAIDSIQDQTFSE